jgi:hypothetical protein
MQGQELPAVVVVGSSHELGLVIAAGHAVVVQLAGRGRSRVELAIVGNDVP